jgi:type II secretory pathway pseudopilin PulG
MNRIGDTAASLGRREDGYTLIELLVAATMGLVVLGAAVMMFVGAIKSEPRTSSKVAAIEQGRIAVERITRDVRQASSVLTYSPSQLALITYVKQSTCNGGAASTTIQCRVTYSCSGGACSRTVAQPNGMSPGVSVRVVSDLATSDPFDYTPASGEPGFVEVSLSFQTQEGGPVVIADGASIRNEESS